MIEWYQPKHVTQQDGSRCAGSNCWAAVGAWLARAATGGTANLSPTAFRATAGGGSGTPSPVTGCRSGFESDISKGLRSLGVATTTVRLSRHEARRAIAQERRSVYAVAVDYELWPLDQKCLVTDFDGNHMVGVIGGLPLDVMNPLCDDYQEVDIGSVLSAAERFSVQHGRDGLLWLVRVARPPAVVSVDPLVKRIEALTAANEELRDAIGQVDSLATRIGDALSPYTDGGEP